ncbi:MAG TPA: ThiF family adenylyltransferase [Bacilli bacterium]
MNKLDESNERYSRQMLFPPIGEQGQEKLMKSRVAIAGMGALGCVLANHMVRAGIGYVRLIDRDYVELSNLQRQMLYDEDDALNNLPKVIAAAQKLSKINSSIQIDPHVVDLNSTNAEDLLKGVDLILDGSDNFAVRFLINDISIKFAIPWIYGGAVSSRGVCMTILPGQTPCLRCIFNQFPAAGTVETCDTSGVIGPIIHVVASSQAAEALKILTGALDQLNRQMIHFDLWFNQHIPIEMNKARKEDCPACALKQFDYLFPEVGGDMMETLCGRDSVQFHPSHPSSLDLLALAERLKPIGQVELNPFLLKFHIDEVRRLVIFPDGRVIIQGCSDICVAKSLYSRYIGN